jgi:Type I phosphodiesterase / nucleotide pyrophosphatase
MVVSLMNPFISLVARSAASLRGWTASVLVLALAACSPSAPETDLPTRVYVLGLDAISHEMVEELVEARQLPNFARVLREGAHTTLQSPDPLEPTQLWTTALTGKRPSTHKVVGEYIALPGSGLTARTPSSARDTQNLLQIVGSLGHSVLSVGLPGTWPAEVVNGSVVANGYRPHRWTTASEHSFDIASTGMTTYPPELMEEIGDLIHGVDEVAREDVSRFFVFNEREFQMLYDKPLGSIRTHDNPPRDFALTLQSDRSNLAIARRLSERYRPRLVITDLELASAVSPTFWYFARPQVYDTPQDSRRRLGRAVPETYRWIDEQIGGVMEQLPEGSTLVLVAPSGFGNGERTNNEGEAVTIPVHTSQGHLWMWGRGIARGAQGEVGRVEDLTPTVLALLDLDVGADMDGSVLVELLDREYLAAHPLSTIESHDLEWDREQRYLRSGAPDSDGDSNLSEEQP